MSPRRATPQLLAVARGDAPADLLLTGGRVFVPSTREWIVTDLAIFDGVIAGWGRRDAAEVVDVSGTSITPGFVDAHMHLESTKLWVDEFVRMVLPTGTTAVAADPHEIANVFGIPGVAALVQAASGLPFTFGVCASSCVPASHFESPGAELDAADLTTLFDEYGAIGIAEMMNFPGVVNGDPDVLAKIATAGNRRVDGHAPGLSGPPLDAYLAAGIESDHECTELAEAEEKRRKAMWVFIREGSASRNLRALIQTVIDHGTDRVALCTDDREPDTLLRDGHVNDCVRLAVSCGVALEDALVLVTSNPADYHHFDYLGCLAPGYQADVLCFEDLASLRPARVWQAGRLVAANGSVVPGVVPDRPAPQFMRASVHLDPVPAAADLDLAPPAGGRARVIGIEENSLTTRQLVLDVTDPSSGVARIGVVERHHRTGRVGLGYVHGFGLTAGAIASTVAHDAHNCMVVGAIDASGPADMAVALARLAEIGGGQVAVRDGKVLAEVDLPIGGLMSDQSAVAIAAAVEHLATRTFEGLGITIRAPFMQLSFLGLSVLPELRITDRGLVDVTRFSLVDVTAG
ncbi:MAG: adenine deaminase [Acidimicrobiales bacterium]|jgi:adenine deaminase